jgi:hypothetical protein
MISLKLNKFISILTLSTIFAFNTNAFAQSSDNTTVESQSSSTSLQNIQIDPEAVLRLKLLNDIKENKFGSDSIKQYIAEHPNSAYSFYSRVTTPNCKVYMNIFVMCNYTENALQITKVLQAGKGDIEAKTEELSKEIEHATHIVEYRPGVYYLSKADNSVIVIDTNYPLEANPVFFQNGNKTESLITISDFVNDQKRDPKEREVEQQSDNSKNSASLISAK